MFGKKITPAPKPEISLQVLTTDYLIDGQLNDSLEEGLIHPWLMRLGNPGTESHRPTVRLIAARIQSVGMLNPPAASAAQFNVWLQNILVVIAGDATGQQMVTTWAQKTLRRQPVRGVFYVGPYVIQGTALAKEGVTPPTLGIIVPIVDASIISALPGARVSSPRAAAVIIGTERLHGYETA